MSFFETVILFITFLISLSLVWSSLRTGITPVPSSRKARQAILAATEGAPAGTILELGSGWGNLALALARKYPQRQVIGFEISFFPWLVSVVVQHLQGVKNLTFRRQNFLSGELPPAALLVCYLYPGGMQKLAAKLRAERPPIDALISNTFALPGWEPARVTRLGDLYKSPIYLYRFEQPQKDNPDD